VAEILKVYPDMFGAVYPHLLRALDPTRPEAEWRPLFRPGWQSPEEHVGYALSDGGRLVGFVGLLFSEVWLEGRAEKLCNVTSWIVEERYRGEGVTLLLPVRKASGYTVTNMSGEPHVREIFQRLGFDTLEESTAIMRPPLSPRGYRIPKGLRILTDPADFPHVLAEIDLRIYADHAPYARHLVAVSGEGSCYGVFSVRRRRRLRTALFHHLSDPATFVRALPSIRRHLFRRYGVVLAECDARLLAGVEVPAGFQIKREFPRLFRSSTLNAASVPNLYSEVILLNLE
jgi:hypothetical protein